jgi:hypothetical protein
MAGFTPHGRTPRLGDDFVVGLLLLQDVKCCFSDDTLPDGYAVNEGDMVHYQQFPMGRMEFLWGADAEEFRPERWLDGAGVFVPESSFKFTAFQVKSFIIQHARDLFLSNYDHLQCP